MHLNHELSMKQLLKYEEIDDFVDLFSNHFSKEEICIYSELLDGNTTVTNVSSITEAVWKYDKFLRENANKPEIESIYHHYLNCFLKYFYHVIKMMK